MVDDKTFDIKLYPNFIPSSIQKIQQNIFYIVVFIFLRKTIQRCKISKRICLNIVGFVVETLLRYEIFKLQILKSKFQREEYSYKVQNDMEVYFI